ncbi:MAG TPA: hypothetical protein VGD67_23890 [Pseudonocardiaceae bacterium]
MQLFEDDDNGYVAWLAANPDGFVLNTERNPTRSYLKLHRASCRTITQLQRDATTWTTGVYVKRCGTRAELEGAALGFGGPPTPCVFCLP